MSTSVASPFFSPLTPGTRLTLHQWTHLPEDEPGEWRDGVLEEEEMAGFLHDSVVSWFDCLLRLWLRQQRGGFVAISTVKYVVSPTRGRVPDLTVFLPGGHVPPREGAVTTPPDVAVEVISPTPRDQKRDRVEKLQEYAAFGVKYYWLVDPYLRSFEVLELGADGRYVHAIAATEGVVDDVPGCPGLRVDLSELWSEVDRFGPPEKTE